MLYFITYWEKNTAKAVKFAISIPEEEFEEIEAIRRKKKISRSKLISEALKLLTKKRKMERLIKEYEEGYRKIPEKPLEVKNPVLPHGAFKN